MCHSFWRSIWHLFRHSICHLFCHSTWRLFYYSDNLFGILSDIYSDSLSDMTFCLAFYLTYFPTVYFIWHIFWHSIFGILSDIFSDRLSDIYSDILSGPIFWNSIWNLFGDSLWLRSGRDHFDPAVAVRVRQGPLQSGAFCSGPAATTAIYCSNLALAVEVRRGPLWSGAYVGVRRGPLWSGACCSGPEGTIAISGLQLTSGGDRRDLELAVEVRRRKERKQEEEGRGRRSRADIRSNNPHLTGGESHIISNSGLFFGKPMGKPWPSRSSLYPPAVTWSVGGCTVQLLRSACTSAIEFAVAALNLVDFMLFLFGTSYTLGIKDDAAHPRLDQQNKNYNKHGDLLSISLPATLCLSIIASSVSSWSLILHRQFHTLTSSRNIHPSYITINYCFINYHQHHYFHYHHDCSLLSSVITIFHYISAQYDLWKLNAPIRLQDLLSSFGSSRTPVQYARLIYPKGAWQWPLMANPVENMDKYGNVMG